MDKTSGLYFPELLQVIETVARDKIIDRSDVFIAIEHAIQRTARLKYGQDHDIQVEINRKTGHIHLFIRRDVVDVITNPSTQITLDYAKKIDPNAQLGSFIAEPLPSIDLGRSAAQAARQVITQKVREAERSRQYEEYKNRVGDICSGVVRRVEFGNLEIDLGRADAFLHRNELIPRESFKQGDRIKAYIAEVVSQPKGPQIFLSRSNPQFLAKLFAHEVPEVYDGVIEIKTVARDPGSRAKMAVISKDSSIDPVGACVGVRGNHVQAIVNELQGEKIDIIQWSTDSASFIVDALAPAEVIKVVLDEDTRKVEAIVAESQFAVALGRRAQNVRLASRLTGWNITILTEDEASNRRNEELRNKSKVFVQALDVDEVIAHLLVAEGFNSVEDLLMVSSEELAGIEGFYPEIAQALQDRALTYQETTREKLLSDLVSSGATEALLNFPGMTPKLGLKLAQQGIKTVQDLADLSTDEFLDFVGKEVDEQEAQQLIMQARSQCFDL